MITFRKIIFEDLPFLNEVRNSCADEYLHDNRKFTLEETVNWFTKNDPDFYMIFENKKMVGYFRLSNYSIENKNIYVGADLHVDFRGAGIGYRAYSIFIPFLFDKYKLHKISLEVLDTNIRAFNLYKKLGFECDGTKREEIFKDGQWVDSIIMSMLKKEA